jgi:hypothetical protein
MLALYNACCFRRWHGCIGPSWGTHSRSTQELSPTPCRHYLLVHRFLHAIRHRIQSQQVLAGQACCQCHEGDLQSKEGEDSGVKLETV